MLKKITSIVCLVLRIIVVALGVTINTEDANHSVDDTTYRYSATDTDLPYAAFGGDFYTEIYKGSDYIVDILNDINKSTEIVVKAENGIFKATSANIDATDDLNDTVVKVGRIIVIAIGLMILAYGICNIGIAFTKNTVANSSAIAAVETPDKTSAVTSEAVGAEKADETPTGENSDLKEDK